MPARTTPLVSHQVYHVFNKIQNDESLFTKQSTCQLMIDAIWYYQYNILPMKLSYFRHQSVQVRESLSQSLEKGPRLVHILAYCLMPNHYHLLIRQQMENGISIYIGNIQNSFTRSINIKRKTKGHVFIGQFKAARMESEEQLLHVSRYIHLNPYTGYLVKTIDGANEYPWSSYSEYVSERKRLCDQGFLLTHFNNKKSYRQFIEDQKNYQRTLANIKYSLFE